MRIVGIHGFGWVRGNIIEVWDAEIRQSEPQMTVVRRVCTPEQPNQTNKTQDLARRGKVDQWSHGCTVGMIIGLKDPTKQDKGGSGGSRAAANQSNYSKKPKTLMQKCININTKNEVKPPQK